MSCLQWDGEFKLFTDLLRSERFYEKDWRRVAAKVSQTVNFIAFAKEWKIHVHLSAAENWDKNNQIYYKLPEQLEKHHRMGENSRREFYKSSNKHKLTSCSSSSYWIPKEEFSSSKDQGKRKESTIQSGMFYKKRNYIISLPSKEYSNRGKEKESVMQIGMWTWVYSVFPSYIKKFQLICIPRLSSKQKVIFLIWFKQYLSQCSTWWLTLMKVQKNFSSRMLHIWLSNQQSLIQNLCLDPPPPFQLHKSKKLIHQNNITRRHVLLARMQGASKGIVAKDLETENGAPL